MADIDVKSFYEFYKTIKITTDGRLLVEGVSGGGGDPFSDGYIMRAGYSLFNTQKLNFDGVSKVLVKDITGTMTAETVVPQKMGGFVYDASLDITVACTLSGSIYYSTDKGATWIVTNITAAGANLRGLATDGAGNFVCIGGSASLYKSFYSSDGITWTAGGIFTNATMTRVTWNGTNFIGVGYGSSDSQRIITSPTGATWTVRTDPWSQNGKMYATPAVRSSDGRTVTATYSESTTQQTPFAYTDDDGASWTRCTLISATIIAYVWGVMYSETYSKWFAVGYSFNGNSNLSCIVSSSDGITWALEEQSTKTAYESTPYSILELNNGEIIAFGTSSSIRTTDGIAWTYDYNFTLGENNGTGNPSIFIPIV